MGDSKGGRDEGRIPSQYEGYTIQRVHEVDSQWIPKKSVLHKIRDMEVVSAKIIGSGRKFDRLPKEFNMYNIQAEEYQELLEALDKLSSRYENIALYCEDLVCNIKLDKSPEKKASLMPDRDKSHLKLIHVPSSEIREAVSYSREHLDELWDPTGKDKFYNLDIVFYAYQFSCSPRLLDRQEHRLLGRFYATWFCWGHVFELTEEEKLVIREKRQSDASDSE